eukprot:CAMPEP_0113575848 /NCGR_PEP_ID=MMETSP0015_2-20120614/27936_1 /TAXON_ID=2838 /ORGANISM="Odontella" /LENGTH=141 /DNA_ID=CAMNT_0000479153 /DNA_START=164 /DNA_END=585 /DNA_ORIENTATION=+ /assembly_acc=CAM_ASM_000160
MSAEPNMVPSDTTQSCSRIDETKAPLHLSLTSLRPGTSDSVIPSVEFFSQPLINNNNATTQVSKLSTSADEDAFQGGIVSDDSWSECSEFTRDDDDLSVSSVSDMEDSTFEALKTGVSDDGVEGAMELDDVSLFEPLDFRV